MSESVTTINDYELSEFSAHLVEYTVSAAKFENAYLLPPKAAFPLVTNGSIGLKTITLDMDFEGEPDEIALNISNVTAMLMKGAEVFLEDGFFYTCIFEKSSVPKEKAPWIMRVKFTLSGTRHGYLCTERATGSKKIFVDGNRNTPAVVKITPPEGVTEIFVNDIVVRNVTGTVIIDGIKKTVTQGGHNKFADAVMTKWLELAPGTNQISITEGAAAEISYYPLFL